MIPRSPDTITSTHTPPNLENDNTLTSFPMTSSPDNTEQTYISTSLIASSSTFQVERQPGLVACCYILFLMLSHLGHERVTSAEFLESTGKESQFEGPVTACTCSQALALATSTMKWQEGIECCREPAPQISQNSCHNLPHAPLACLL